jgi:hypothetical protein
MSETDDVPSPRRSPLAAWRGLTRGRTAASATPEEELNLKPSAMRGTEAMYGYVVALELFVVAVINLAVTHGPGAPAHPQTALSLVGLAASIVLVAIMQTKNRMVVSLSAIGVAFFVTLPAVPNSVRAVHILALIVPVVYAFVLTQRQRRATTALARAGRTARSSAARAPATKGGPADDRHRRRAGKGKKGAASNGPTRSARYTPPKPKRSRPQPAPEPAADQRRKWWGRPD